jgi:O-antigen ligase
MVPFLIYLSPPKRRLPFAVAIIVAALATSLSLNERAIRRFRMAFDTNEYNYQLEDGRINIWKRGIGYIVSKPIQGVGINGFQFQELATKKNTGFGIRQAAAHNMYIQVASELGVIGFGGFVAMIWLAWRGCTRVRKRLRPLILQGSDPELRAELLRANMAQAAILSVLFTGFFLSLGYSAMLFFSVAAAIGIGLGGGLTGPVTGHPAPTFQQPPRRGGQRGWRSARPVPTISRADSSTPGA